MEHVVPFREEKGGSVPVSAKGAESGKAEKRTRPFRLLREHIAGFDVSDGWVSAAMVRMKRNGRVKVTHAGMLPCPPDGDEKALSVSVHRLWRELRIPTHTVTTCFHGPSLVTKYCELPLLTDQELASALKLEAQQLLQQPEDEVCMDWQLYNGAPRKHSTGMLTAVPKADVLTLMHRFDAAGLYPVEVGTSGPALAGLYACLKHPVATESICLIHFTETRADVVVLWGAKDVYARTIFCRVGGWAESLGWLRESIEEEVDFVRFRVHEREVQRIVLTGKVPDPAEVTQALGRPVEVWNPVDDMIVAPGPGTRFLRRHPERGSELALALGTALQGGAV